MKLFASTKKIIIGKIKSGEKIPILQLAEVVLV